VLCPAEEKQQRCVDALTCKPVFLHHLLRKRHVLETVQYPLPSFAWLINGNAVNDPDVCQSSLASRRHGLKGLHQLLCGTVAALASMLHVVWKATEDVSGKPHILALAGRPQPGSDRPHRAD